MRSRRIRLAAVAAALLAFVVVSPTAAADPDPVCRDVEVPVSLVGGLPADQMIYGQLCDPRQGPSRTLQILLHGVTYDHHYWDMPGFGGRYSYVRYMAEAGYSTLALDRIGSGRSSHPLGTLITAVSNADVVHQVIQAVRGGDLPGGPRSKIVTVGHSYGTVVAEQEAALYRDVDGVIGTGWLNLPGVVPSALLFAQQHPAGLDPKFPHLLLDPSYLTTRPGTRGYFYQPGNYDPEVLAKDEELKQTDTTAELQTFAVPALVETALKIEAPTLLVVGEHDVFFCTPPEHAPCTENQTIESQRQYFAPEAGLEAYVQRGAGHDIALELNNRDGFRAMLSWLRRNFPV